jgi:uncharacterized membrane protein YdjX (TVP38/TMEM64 family)
MITTPNAHARRWSIVTLLAVAFVLVPFALFGERLDTWSIAAVNKPETSWLVFVSVVALLVADVLLPVPSSVVSTMAGAFLGAPVGAFASWVGMTLGCVVAYAIGAVAGRQVVRRISGDAIDALERDMERFGPSLVAMGRPVPVLAEATTLIAGATRMNFKQFITVSSLANLGISIVYSATGALSIQAGSFILAVVASMALPATAWWVVTRVLKQRRSFRESAKKT